jgi:glycine oxidase
VPKTPSSCAGPVAVIGGGVVGLAIAWELARAGLRVTVLERDVPGGEASRAAGGMLAPLGEAASAGPFLRLALESRRRYPDWIQRLEAAADTRVGFRICGKVLVAPDAAAEEELRSRAGWLAAAGHPVEWLDPPALRRREPALSSELRGGVRLRTEGLVHNPRLHGALARAAAAAGAEVRFGAGVAAVESRGGCVRGVRLTGGERVAAERVVLAAGAWSGRVAGLPRPLPVRPIRGQILQLCPTSAPLTGLVASPGAYLIPRSTPAGPSVVVGASEEEVGFRVETDPGTLRRLRDAAVHILPALRGAPVARSWAGLRPGTPDDLPVLGADPELAGLIHASGHFRNGILLAPVTAAAVAALVTGTRGPDLGGFGVERFQGAGRG